MWFGNNGIINKAFASKETFSIASAKAEISLAWASCEIDYNLGKAGDYTVTREDYYTLERLNNYLKGKGTVNSINFKSNGASRIEYSSDNDKNIKNKIFKINENGIIELSYNSSNKPETSKLII